MAPTVRFHNRTDKPITFVMELGGSVVSVGVCKIHCVEPGKVIKVSQVKILRYSHRYESSWKIRVLLDGIYRGLLIQPIHLLSYAWIVFSIEILDDGSVVLKAKGLTTRAKSSRRLMQQRWSFGVASKRHREYRMLEEMYDLEDIGEARMTDEGMRHCQSLLHDDSICTVPRSSNAESCEQLWHDGSVFQSIVPLLDGMHDAATVYDTGNKLTALTDEADAQADINVCINNGIQEGCDIVPQEITTNTDLQSTIKMELSENLKNYSVTEKLLGSGRSASKRWLAYSKQKAMSLIGTTNSWIAIIYDTSIPDN